MKNAIAIWSSLLLILLYSIYLNNIAIALIYIALFGSSYLCLRYIILSQIEILTANGRLIITIFFQSIFIITLSAIFVDIERSYSIINGTHLTSVGNEGTFFFHSSTLAESLISWFNISHWVSYHNFDHPIYIIFTALLQYLSLELVEDTSFFIQIIPNVFLGSLTLALTIDAFHQKVGLENKKWVYLISPFIIIYSVVGMRDMIVILFTILPIFMFEKKGYTLKNFIILLISLIILYYSRIMSFLFLSEFILLQYFLNRGGRLTDSKKTLYILITAVLFLLSFNFAVEIGSRLASNDISTALEYYRFENTKSAEGSLAVWLYNSNIPGVPFLSYLLKPLIVGVLGINSFYTFLLGYSSYYWNALIFSIIILAYNSKSFRKSFLNNTINIVALLVIFQIFFLSSELRHKVPFMIMLSPSIFATIVSLKITKKLSSAVIKSSLILLFLLVCYLFMKVLITH